MTDGAVAQWLPDPLADDLLPVTKHRFAPYGGLEGKEAVFPEPLDECRWCHRVRIYHIRQYGLAERPPIEWTFQLARNVQLMEWRMEQEDL